jgi:hypothetical protein
VDSLESSRKPASLPAATLLALPIAASVFAAGIGLVALGDAYLALLRGLGAPPLSDLALVFFLLTHLVIGSGLLVAGLVGLSGALRNSDGLLLFSGILGSTSLATIVLLQTLSLWSLRYLE